jgi:hypothetical protein
MAVVLTAESCIIISLRYWRTGYAGVEPAVSPCLLRDVLARLVQRHVHQDLACLTLLAPANGRGGHTISYCLSTDVGLGPRSLLNTQASYTRILRA